MEINRVGVDLAKNIFQLHGADRKGKTVWKRRLSRGKWLKVLCDTVAPGTEIGMEACAGAHHWARLLTERGYVVKIIPPQFVKPFIKSNKNDANDAQAICEAMHRPNMHPVRMKTVDQQITVIAQENPTAKRLQQLRGVGPLIATALVATIGDGKQYRKGRDMAAALGLTPKQHSSGGKDKLLGISKRGDAYLRCLLVHGARSAVRTAKDKEDRLSRWIIGLQARRHSNVVAVAMANKMARMAWAMMTKGADYDPDFNPVSAD